MVFVKHYSDIFEIDRLYIYIEVVVRIHVRIQIGYFEFSGVSDFWVFRIEAVRVLLYFGSGLGIFSLGSIILGRVQIFKF